MNGFKRSVVFLFTLLAKGLFLLKVSELFDFDNGLIFADEAKSINFVKVNDNRTEPVLKLLTADSEIYSHDYSHITDTIVWCEKNAIKYAELNSPHEQNTLIDDRCNSIAYDWYNDIIYFYLLTSKQIVAIKRFSEFTRTRNQNYIYSLITRTNVTSLKCDPFRSQLFWIEHNTSSDTTHQLMQLSLASDQNQLIPRAYLIDKGSPKLFGINYEYQKLYVITQNDYLIEVNYNEYESPTKIIASSSEHFRKLSSISYCTRYIYFQDTSQNAIVAYYVQESTDQFIAIASVNTSVLSIKCIRDRLTRQHYNYNPNNISFDNAIDTNNSSNISTPICPTLTKTGQDSTQTFSYAIFFGVTIPVILVFVFGIIFLRKRGFSYGILRNNNIDH